VHSVLLHPTFQDAVGIPKGDIRLGYCGTCGFISNTAFDASLQNYLSQNYEATQAYSGTFNAFHRGLAARLVDQYNLRNKRIIEIGCGQGEFLDLLCTLGGNTGIGFDPAYVEARTASPLKENVTIVKDYYTEDNSRQYQADFVCCKMTLEHIHETYEFVRMIAKSLVHQPDTIIFFQVPNAQKVLEDIAFWDIYYEHCSYFSQGSLAYLFQHCGFQVLRHSVEYDHQYITIEAKLDLSKHEASRVEILQSARFEEAVHSFYHRSRSLLQGWKKELSTLNEQGKRVVLWGGGSKAVAFLTTLKITNEIEYIVDINPNKNGTYLAGTGQKIVSLEYLENRKPDLIIIMNPIYRDEIKSMLDQMGISAELISINSLFT
jgi:2-polyprenyl-3-methyl-5-hydroxy-6-metoxy-1,4-benzoquinol methylase